MKVKIYQPSKTATQSGKKDQSWILVPTLETQTRSTDNIMSWTSSNNTLSQIKLKFTTLEEAEEYAQNQGLSYKIINPKSSKMIKKSYADNFTN